MSATIIDTAHGRDSERGAADFRTPFAPVDPFVRLNSLSPIQKMAPDILVFYAFQFADDAYLMRRRNAALDQPVSERRLT